MWSSVTLEERCAERRGDRAGDWSTGFPETALIIGGTSDFVPRWQMVG